jgi:hypothetical protein
MAPKFKRKNVEQKPGFAEPEAPQFKLPKENPKTEPKITEAREGGQLAKLRQEANRLNDQLLMTEWALTGGRQQVFTWLQEVKGFNITQAKHIVARRPLPQWARILEYVQNNYSNNLVRRHMENAARANDQHMMAAQLGMAKAMEFLSKMNVETKVDKKGQPYFAHFKTADLKACMDSIATAQKITRVALGLPSDEGSVHIWTKIQQTINTTAPVAEDLPPDGEDLKVQVMRLQKTYSYDDIKTMITAFRQAGLRADRDQTLEAEVTKK